MYNKLDIVYSDKVVLGVGIIYFNCLFFNTK